MELLKKLLAAGAVVNPPPELLKELAELGLFAPPPPSPNIVSLSQLLKEPARDHEFNAAVRHLLPPILEYSTHATQLIYILSLWRNGLTSHQSLAAAYDTFRQEISP